jgi:metal-sulfur cluster biosynthetic enzyme
MADFPTETEARAVLASVVDPCSRSAGVPASLEEMGLLRKVEVSGNAIDVAVTLTEPFCVMGGWFLQESRSVLRDRWPEAEIRVVMDRNITWTEADMSAAYQQRLAEHRAATVRSSSVTIRPRAQATEAVQ